MIKKCYRNLFYPNSKALTPSAIDQQWFQLAPSWSGNFDDIQNGLPHCQLPPSWQLLLLGDGSPTRHLQLLTGEPTEVDVLDMSIVGMDRDRAPIELQEVSGPRLRRQVWLRTPSGQRLAYATSWWNAEHVDEYLQNRDIPIWASLAKLRTELYRDVRGICCGTCPALSKGFGEPGILWGRHYLFWHQGKPLTLIYEVFSPYLQRYLGMVPPV